MSHFLKKLVLLVLAGWLVLAAGNCALLGLEDEDDDNTDLLNLLALFVIANQNQGCQNTSGLVICIPPGLRR